MSVERGRLKPQDEKKIQDNYAYLLKELDDEDIATQLFTKRVINADDKDDIDSKPTRKAKVEELLKKVLHSGPNEAFNKFLEAVGESHQHVIEKLQETDVSDCPSGKSDSWVDDAPEPKLSTTLTNSDASRIAFCLGQGWEHLFLRLGLSNVIIEREKMSNPVSSASIVVTNLLIKWTHRVAKQATWEALLRTLRELESDALCTIDWAKLKELVIK